MKTLLTDFQGTRIRLTRERAAHILEHPEMSGMDSVIEETLKNPEQVVESLSDESAHLYYRFYIGTRVGNKYLCVVVKIVNDDAFVLTAYLTNAVKKGRTLWPRR